MEIDVIQNIFSHLFDVKNTELVLDSNSNSKEYRNSDNCGESYSLIWSRNDFTEACSKLAKRCKHTDETLRAPLTADILACLKFETDVDVQTTDTTCRRMLFSTGFSISVENLFPCGSDSDIKAVDSCEFLLNDSDFHDVDYEEYDYCSQGIHRVGEQILCTGDSNLDEEYTVYSDPFDPKLTFEGLAHIFSPTPDIGADARQIENNGPNFLLAFDDPSSLVCEYLGAYRNCVSHMSHDLRPVTKKSPAERNQCHQEIEEIAKRNTYDAESEILFSKIMNTKELWSRSDDLSPQHIETGGSQLENIKKDVTDRNIDYLYADTKRKDCPVEAPSAMKSQDNQSLSGKNRPTKTESDLENSTEHELFQDKLESSCDEMKSVDDIIDRVSRKYAYHNYSRNDIRKMLVAALRNRNDTISKQESDTISKQGSETVNEICTEEDTSSCTDGMEMVDSKFKSGHSVAQIDDRDASLEATDNVKHSIRNDTKNSRGKDISQKYQSHRNGDDLMDQQQSPLFQYPYGSSIFWKENDYDLNRFDSVQYQHPNLLQPSVSNPKPEFNEMDQKHPKTHFSPQFLLPHYTTQIPQVAPHPPYQTCHTGVQGQNQRAVAPFHQLQLQQQQIYYHQPPPVQNSFRNPPPFVQHHHPYLGPSMTLNQPIYSTFPVHQSIAQNLSNQNMLAHGRLQSPSLNSTTTQLFNQPITKLETNNHRQFTFHEQKSREAIQPKDTFEPELHSSELEQNTKPNRSEPEFILPCLSVPPPTLPCVPNSSAIHHIRPYQTTGDTQALHHTDPNFRLDDEIWYINGIPHRHARPIHNLHSVMPFYPYNEYKGSDFNKCGINRRIAEQVAKINQTYSEPTGITSKTRLADNSMPLEAHVTKSKLNARNCERNDTITLYPVNMSMMCGNGGNLYQRIQKNKSHNCLGNRNNSNVEMPRASDSYCVMIDNFKDALINDEEITCSRDFAFSTEAHDVCEDTKGTNIDEYKWLALRNNKHADRPNASVILLESNVADINREAEGCNSPCISMKKEIEQRQTKSGYNSEHSSYEMVGPSQNSNRFIVKTRGEEDAHNGNTTNFTENQDHSLFAASRLCDSRPATQQQFRALPMDTKPEDTEMVSKTSDVRCIPVLGRNRRQKESDTSLRKRKDISRKTLLQIV